MRRPPALVLITAAVVAAIGAYVAYSAYGPVQQVAVGTPIRHDDFFFTVTNVARAGGTHYTVTVLVQNRAKRVDYDWRDAIAYVQDGAGKRYAPVSEGTFTVEAGGSREANVIFDVPAGARDPELRFWDGIFMGDAFDGSAYSRTAVRLST